MKWVIYVIRAGQNKNAPFKIGVTHNLEKRMESLQVANAYPLVAIAVIPCESRAEAYGLENYLHRRLNKIRMQGEWFKGELKLKPLLSAYQKITGNTYVSRKPITSNKNTIIEQQRVEIKILKDKIKKLEFEMDEYLDSENLNYFLD